MQIEHDIGTIESPRGRALLKELDREVRQSGHGAQTRPPPPCRTREPGIAEPERRPDTVPSTRSVIEVRRTRSRNRGTARPGITVRPGPDPPRLVGTERPFLDNHYIDK